MRIRSVYAAIVFAAVSAPFAAPAAATEFFRPWADPKRAIVLDGYAHNILDFEEIVTDNRVTAFIHKGSDGRPPQYRCTGDDTTRALCRKTWQRYAISRELYQTRRALAKQLGLKWGAYHLGRPGDPLEQARHFLEFTDPGPDELIAIDIEGLDAEKWMSLDDAEVFAIAIRAATGRYPVLYANEIVSRYIADNSHSLPILSRLPLWYARYKPAIRSAFPKGNWRSYLIWQFAYQGNCSKKRCPYRVPGTGRDIDVNIVDMSPDALRAAWPFGKLAEMDMPLQIPFPVARPHRPEFQVPMPATGLAALKATAKQHAHSRMNRVSGYRQYASIRLGRPVGVDRMVTSARRKTPSPVNDLY